MGSSNDRAGVIRFVAASHCLRAATSSGFRARTSWIKSGSTSLLRSAESVSCARDSPLLKNITSTARDRHTLTSSIPLSQR